MFVVDMKKGLTISFIINIILVILLIIMTILFFIKGTKKVEESLGLQTIAIDNYDIDFKSDRYAYLINVENNVEQLDIDVVAYEKDAEIKITGNEKIKEGYNQIIISVKSKKKTPKKYYIEVIKEKFEEKDENDEKIEKDTEIDVNKNQK